MSKLTQLLIAIIALVIFAEAWILFGDKIKLPIQNTPLFAAELKHLKEKQLPFHELAKYFTEIAEDKGAEYAYELLKIAPVSPNIDMHLLGHVVSDELYKQKGSEGIKTCTPDFRNACSHSIVVGLLLEKGPAAMQEISDACRLAPGGKGAYTMCFHGLGHGVLAYSDYDMENAIELCTTTGTKAYNNREYIECVGGTVMEIIGGGFHNQELWEKKSAEYLNNDDPLYLCSKKIMPEEVQGQCYTYLTPHLFKYANGDLGNLQDDVFERAFKYCDAIPETETTHRTNCFGGFGKEFVVLAKARDIRNIETMTKEELSKIYAWCNLAPHEEAVTMCVNTATASIFWGGENKPDAAINFCGIIKESQIQSSCFSGLIGAVSFYIEDRPYRKNFCANVPESYNNTCKTRLLN